MATASGYGGPSGLGGMSAQDMVDLLARKTGVAPGAPANAPTPASTDKIHIYAKDGKVWEAEWTPNGLKILKEIQPPKGSPQGGGAGQSMKDLFPEKKKEDPIEEASKSQPSAPPKQQSQQQGQKGSPDSPPPPQKISAEDLKPISDNAFKSRLQSIMRDNMYDRRVKGKTRGKLDMTRLPKVPTGATNVFTKKEEKKNKKYSIVLCVDTSSSMSDYGKNRVAADATALLVRTLQLVGIDVAVVGFGPVAIWKDFNTTADKKMISQIHNRITAAPGGTPMYPGMYVGYELLRKREGHKMMIVMADGSPDYMYSRLGKVLRMKKNGEVLEYKDIKNFDHQARYDEMRDELDKYNNGARVLDFYEIMAKPYRELSAMYKDIDTIGIGIMQDGMERFIPNSRKVDSINDLKPVIVHEIKKKVRRG